VSLFLYLYNVMIGTKLLNFDDKLFQLIEIFDDTPNFPIAEAKEYYDCDTCLRRDGKLYFCQMIEDAQVIEEIHE